MTFDVDVTEGWGFLGGGIRRNRYKKGGRKL
jgi:hypothetical protein